MPSEVPLIELSASEKAGLREVTAPLQRQLRASERFTDYVADPPAPDSPMSRAYTDGNRDEFDLGALGIYAAEDHLRTLSALIETRILPSFALYTVLRGAVESLARAHYVLMEMDLTERQGRALNLRLDNLREQVRITDREPSEDRAAGRRVYEERRRFLVGRASAQGVRTLMSSTGRLRGFGAHVLPPKGALVDRAVKDGALAYSMLSGYAHGLQWALLRTEGAEQSSDPAVALVPTALNVEVFLGVLDRVTDLHDQIVARWITLAGQPFDVWTAAKDN